MSGSLAAFAVTSRNWLVPLLLKERSTSHSPPRLPDGMPADALLISVPRTAALSRRYFVVPSRSQARITESGMSTPTASGFEQSRVANACCATSSGVGVASGCGDAEGVAPGDGVAADVTAAAGVGVGVA